MPDRASSTKQGCNCGAFGYLVRACIVSRLSFVEVLLLRLLQQRSQRAMLFRISLLMGSPNIYLVSTCPVWDTWASYCNVPWWASAQLNTLTFRDLGIGGAILCPFTV